MPLGRVGEGEGECESGREGEREKEIERREKERQKETDGGMEGRGEVAADLPMSMVGHGLSAADLYNCFSG